MCAFSAELPSFGYFGQHSNADHAEHAGTPFSQHYIKITWNLYTNIRITVIISVIFDNYNIILP